MSFAPSPYGQISNEEFFSNPRLAMLRALQQQGINTDRNFFARRALDRSNELVPLAYAYGANVDNFTDFANQYAQSLFNKGGAAQGMFSNPSIAQHVQGLLGSTNGDAYDWLSGGDPEEQFQRLASLKALANRANLPGFAQAQQRALQNQFQNWWLRMTEDPTGAGVGGATTFVDALMGRSTPYASPEIGGPGGAAPGGAPGGNPAAGPVGSAPGSPVDLTGQYLNLNNRNYNISDLQQAQNAWDALMANRRGPTAAGRMSFSLGNLLNYDAGSDFWRYYWGNQRYQNGVPQLGYSNFERLLRWVNEQRQQNPQANPIQLLLQQAQRLREWYASQGLDFAQSGLTLGQ